MSRRLLALLLLPSLLGCESGSLLGTAQTCKPLHQLEDIDQPRTDLANLEKLIRLPVRPTRVFWTKGPLRLGPGQVGTLPGGDWELIALLEFSEGDSAELITEDGADLSEVELPGLPWAAKQLGVALTRPSPTNPCEEVKMRVSGFKQLGAKFERYFLRTKVFLKMPGSSFFVLWLSTA